MTVTVDGEGLPVRTPRANPYGAEVYWLFDRDGHLLYVGMGGEARTRLLEHRRVKPWWPDVDLAKTRVYWYESRREAADVETQTIEGDTPRHNVLGTPRHGVGLIKPAKATAFGAHRVLGAAEIREGLGVSRQRVQQLIGRPDFPEPHDTLAMGKVWLRQDIERWARARQMRLTGDSDTSE
jgi:predicted DNA-binding transcriptional regulator AlpA